MDLHQAGGPPVPEGQRVAQGSLGVQLVDRVVVGELPLEPEGGSLALPHGERTDMAHVLAFKGHRAVDLNCVWAGNCPDAALCVDDPWDLGAVLEADGHLCGHLHRASQALHYPEDPGAMVAGRHEVSHPDAARRCVPFLVEHHGGPSVRAARRRTSIARCEQPATVLRRAQQSGKTGGRIEAGHAQPVDRPVPADKASGVGVTDKGVVLDPLAHVLATV